MAVIYLVTALAAAVVSAQAEVTVENKTKLYIYLTQVDPISYATAVSPDQT